MNLYAADTHALVWYLSDDKQLSRKVRAIFDNLHNSQDHIFIPTIVLAEVMVIAEKSRASVKYDEVVNFLSNNNRCTIMPLTIEIVETARQITGASELFDRLIAATAIYLDAKLITRDAVLARLKNVETVW